MRHPPSDAVRDFRLSRRSLLLAGAVGVLALGLYLRFDSIAASLSVDEFGTFWVVEHGLETAFHRTLQFQGQSPFYYALAWTSIRALGESEVALRIPSLLLGCVFVPTLYLSARMLGGSSAGCYAAALGWLAAPSIRASVQARPYGLVLFCVAIAILGFHSAVRSGSRSARLLWVVGGAAVGWAHYVQYPLVLGLFAAYALLPQLRTAYKARQCVLDAVLQVALLALCLPHVLALLARRESLSWIDESHYLVFVPLLMPVVPAIALGSAARERADDSLLSALRLSLWIGLIVHLGTLELAAVIGINLLAAHYFLAVLVPGLLLAASALSRVQTKEAVVACVAFAILTGATFMSTKRATGTYSGIGYDDWRGAVDDLTARLGHAKDALVLFRSGFVEEDSVPVGSPAAATLAPLRSPGRPAVDWRIRSLTFRWSHPARERYFDDMLLPEVRDSSRFYVLTARWGGAPHYYPDEIVRWVEDRCPGSFRIKRFSFRGVDLFEFQRHDR